MANIGNLFNNQTANGNSNAVELNASHKNLKIEGVFDGAIIKLETTFYDKSWIEEKDNNGIIIEITQPDNLCLSDQVVGTKFRLVLSNAGVSTNITAGIF